MRIAITNCKSKKQNYPCSVDEMYSLSPVYRSQSQFFKKAYDDYYVMSFHIGIKHHTDVIEPYELCLGVSSNDMAEKNQIVKPDPNKVKWVNRQLKEMIDKGWEIDLHISMNYYKLLSNNIKEQLNHIKQPMGVGKSLPKYREALGKLDNESLDKCLEFISYRDSSKPKEEPIWYYHPEHKSFFGTSAKIVSAFPELKLNSGDMWKISTERVKQARGWVKEKTLLPKLHKTDSGQWRLKK